jgi:3-deoxy-D-manno-octulosonate 8-phosphate phosphatase (KDO 8-P phosphatase)
MVDLKDIQMLLLDVDGVLTDGRIVYTSGGDELKAFNAKDGLGIRMLQAAGIRIGIVTGRSSPALNRRCEELGIRHLYDGVADKGAVLDQITAETGIRSQAMAFVGDDLPDCPLMRAVGVPIAVADAHPAVTETARWTTRAAGGRGAVREVCEKILSDKGMWEKLLTQF